jgi:hypothetical protein
VESEGSIAKVFLEACIQTSVAGENTILHVGGHIVMRIV